MMVLTKTRTWHTVAVIGLFAAGLALVACDQGSPPPTKSAGPPPAGLDALRSGQDASVDTDTLVKTCVVCDASLGSTGSVAHTHEGRKMRCCGQACLGKLEADPAKYMAKFDGLVKKAKSH